MTNKRQLYWLAGMVMAGVLWAGCAGLRSRGGCEFLAGESLVLVGDQPGKLACAPCLTKPVDVRSTYRTGLPQTVHYEAGRDYVLDASGAIKRTQTSRIPDFGTNMLYGQEDFRHDRFPGFGNKDYFIYVDYFHPASELVYPPASGSQARFLKQTQHKLQHGEYMTFVAYGDSITAGGEATEPGLVFWERWVDSLRQKYPQAAIRSQNGATGGDSTVQGIRRLEEKVLRQKPDLVLLAFGMNDHNIGSVPLKTFADNLRSMIDRIRRECGSEIVLCSAFPPNPKWHHSSHQMERYAAVTEEVAKEKQCAFADVYRRWMTFAAKKKPEDMLANNINHPNDFGHWIYFEALRSLDL